MSEPNIILAGFMGTGKTVVGKIVAERLGRPFVDLDDQIAARAGKAIPAIFAEDGEAAFRALESAACEELRTPRGLVVAAGGGAVLSARNRTALSAGGMVICLEAAPEALAQRLGEAPGRPMLARAAGVTVAGRIEALLAERAPAYAVLPFHIDTTQLEPDRVADRVLAISADLPEGAYRIPVTVPGAAYDVLVAEGILADAGYRIKRAGIEPGRCTVITNPTVASHHGETLRAALERAGFSPLVLEMPDGEAHKTLAIASDLYHRLAAARASRNEPILALGGGVVGDMAGFIASTWLRGVPFVQVPTTLLAMVDASVGGKTAVDLPEGKNLVGAFKQPELALVDPDVLGTLPPVEFRAGLAEVVKAGIIGDRVLFERLAGDGPGSLAEMIADAIKVKVDVVQHDPHEMGVRAALNLGHTFGHALELLSGYTMRHGEAVSIGMVAAAALSEGLRLCPMGMSELLRDVLGRLGLPVSADFDPDAVLHAMGTDKKRHGSRLRFVVIEDIGQVALLDDAPEAAVRDALAAIQA